MYLINNFIVINGLPKGSTVSLSSMGGESGSDLVSGIMNTVQTSSLPAETAGKAGTPNTGAEAGDAQGQDTGKGSAGAPEQGGDTGESGGASGEAGGASASGGVAGVGGAGTTGTADGAANAGGTGVVGKTGGTGIAGESSGGSGGASAAAGGGSSENRGG